MLNISVPSGNTSIQSPISGGSLGTTAEREIVEDFDSVDLSIPPEETSNERNVQLSLTTNLGVLDVSGSSDNTSTKPSSSDSEDITGQCGEEDFVFVEYPVEADGMCKARMQ